MKIVINGKAQDTPCEFDYNALINQDAFFKNLPPLKYEPYDSGPEAYLIIAHDSDSLA